MRKKLYIAYTGGGTGGHIYPLLAVADEIKKEITSLPEPIVLKQYYFGSPGIYSNEFITRTIQIRRIAHAKLRRYASLLNLIDAIKFPYAFLQALIKMLFVMPDVLFSKGGTGAFPVVLAAWFFRIPVVVHESDSVPGLTNRLSFPFAQRVGIAFAHARDFVSEKKSALVGNPVRPFLLASSDITQSQARKIFGFDDALPLILILGGSQGSQRINSFITDVAGRLAPSYYVLHQTGKNNFIEMSRELRSVFANELAPYRDHYKVVDFFDQNIRDALVAADIIISRAGSGALFEIALFKKPSILIPLSDAAGNHQRINAHAYAQTGAAIVIEEDNLKSDLFLDQLNTLVHNRSLYERMALLAQSFATPYAAAALAQEIIRLGMKLVR